MSRHSGAAKSKRPVTEEKEESGGPAAGAHTGGWTQKRLLPIVLCRQSSHPKPTSCLGRSREPAGYTLVQSALTAH
jgi:hypothetical protein